MLGELFWMLLGGGFIAKEVAKEKSWKMSEKEYMEKHGYDTKKQFAIRSLAVGTPAEKAEFSRRLGRPFVYTTSAELDKAVREIAQKEGWVYYDYRTVMNDPEYLKIFGKNK